MTCTPVPHPVGPVDATTMPRYAGASTFFRMPDISAVSDYDIAVLGVPFDNGTSYRPGARFAPIGVREASRLIRPAFHVELDVAPFRELQIVDASDVPCTPYSIPEAMEQIQRHAAEGLGDKDGRRLISVGGDHTIALPLLRTAVAKHGPVALVHFDAHLDTWDT